ncbi:hypothetical protein Salat_1544300 [Sesamum alatum]|uniref:Uncharacterized protein n=1 Tax=Sesamum alatum TaxID=300844 RepID=A0AAE1YDU3_9LAMI|nr:hypothetical protein Salat_1544300 [Sesamum alatum]
MEGSIFGVMSCMVVVVCAWGVVGPFRNFDSSPVSRDVGVPSIFLSLFSKFSKIGDPRNPPEPPWSARRNIEFPMNGDGYLLGLNPASIVPYRDLPSCLSQSPYGVCGPGSEKPSSYCNSHNLAMWPSRPQRKQKFGSLA